MHPFGEAPSTLGESPFMSERRPRATNLEIDVRAKPSSALIAISTTNLAVCSAGCFRAPNFCLTHARADETFPTNTTVSRICAQVLSSPIVSSSALTDVPQSFAALTQVPLLVKHAMSSPAIDLISSISHGAAISQALVHDRKAWATCS